MKKKAFVKNFFIFVKLKKKKNDAKAGVSYWE